MGEFFSSWKGGGWLVKLIEAKVIVHIWVYLLLPFIYISEMKNHDSISPKQIMEKWPHVTPVQHFCSDFVSSFYGTIFTFLIK